MSSVTPNFEQILRTLHDRGVDFIIVGGVSGVLHGAPYTTQDIDVVHSRTPENVERVLAALAELDALYRDIAGRKLRPNATHLVTPGHQLLDTRFGRLDLLGSLGDGRGYHELLDVSEEMQVAGMRLRVLKLDELIEVKRQAGRDKDKLVLSILEHTLRERDRT